jgi:hypothetical protein
MRLLKHARYIGTALLAIGGLLIWLANRFPLHHRTAPVVIGLVAVAVGFILFNDTLGVDPRDDEPL